MSLDNNLHKLKKRATNGVLEKALKNVGEIPILADICKSISSMESMCASMANYEEELPIDFTNPLDILPVVNCEQTGKALSPVTRRKIVQIKCKRCEEIPDPVAPADTSEESALISLAIHFLFFHPKFVKKLLLQEFNSYSNASNFYPYLDFEVSQPRLLVCSRCATKCSDLETFLEHAKSNHL